MPLAGVSAAVPVCELAMSDKEKRCAVTRYYPDSSHERDKHRAGTARERVQVYEDEVDLW